MFSHQHLIHVRQRKLYLHNNQKIHNQDEGGQVRSGYFVGGHEVTADFVPVEVISSDSSCYNNAHTE